MFRLIRKLRAHRYAAAKRQRRAAEILRQQRAAVEAAKVWADIRSRRDDLRSEFRA